MTGVFHVNKVKKLLIYDANPIIFLMISIGSTLTLADLFEGGGLSMDLFTSQESGREDNFLVDLFVLLVITLMYCCIYCAKYFIDIIRFIYVIYTGSNYDTGWIN